MSKKIIFSAGGTGGHILPAINLMQHFFDKKYEVLLVTDKRGKSFIKDNLKFKSYILNAQSPTGKNFFKKFLSFFVILYSIFQSILILKKEKPDLIFGLGGYVSFPISFASKFFNLPLVIYENNLILGRANKYLSNLSKKVLLANKTAISLPTKNKVSIVGHILDKKLINYKNFKKNKNKNFFSILILGGSQGAKIFGEIIPPAIKMLKEKNYEIEINQQCTAEQKTSIIDFYKKYNIKNYVFDFEKNILELILSSDLAITRCGASSTAELVYALTPFIAVPLPNSIDNHQYLNAKYYKDKGYCSILEQDNFNTKNLFNLLAESIRDKNKLEKIGENMKKDHGGDVYNNIEKEIKEFI